MAIFTWPFPRNPSAPPLLGLMALAVFAAAAIMLAAGLLNLQSPPPARTAQAQNVAADRAALVAFYNATGGDSWTNSANWNTDAPLGNWHGVTTDASGRVIDLVLQNNNLTGSIPPELGDLSDLQDLYLSNNALTGSIPAELGNLSNLQEVDISANNLTGTIPAWLGNLSELNTIDLNGNSLMGTVPAELGRLSSLERLYFNSNQLTGQLPYSFTGLSALNTLRFQVNAGLCAPLDSDFQTWFDGITTTDGPDCPRTRIRSGSGAPVVGEPVIAELTAREDRLARIEATLTEYEADPCIGYDDTRNVHSGWAWDLSDTNSGPWVRANPGKQPHATFVYLPQAADVGKYLRANITVDGTLYNTESIGRIVAEHGVASGDITMADFDGVLAVGYDINASLPEAAAAERGNPAINPRLEPWQWERSDDGNAGWSNVTPYHEHCDTPDAQYSFTDDDANKHVRGYIYYNDDSSGSSVLKRGETPIGIVANP